MDSILKPTQDGEELSLEKSLRPDSLETFPGQAKIKSNLEVFIEAAKQRKEALDHCLFYGPPGLGKTTLAHIIAKTMDVEMKTTSGPALEKKGDLAAILTNLKAHSILFIDEIHRLNQVVEEYLYSAMEDFFLDMITGEGLGARTMKFKLPPFTLIGATTRAGMLTSPLRDRFGIVARLEFYNNEDLVKILKRSGIILTAELNDEAANEIARRSRGTPRIANRLLKRVRDFAQVQNKGKITFEIAKSALTALEVDSKGLDSLDRKILQVIIEKFGGGPTGIDTLASAINEERETLEDVCEPYLIQEGYLIKTPRGRCVMPIAYEHMGFKIPKNAPALLFSQAERDKEAQSTLF